jgi:hypothetical protein
MKACILCLVTAPKNWSYEHLCRVKSIFMVNRAVLFGHSLLNRTAVAVIPVGVVRLPLPPGPDTGTLLISMPGPRSSFPTTAAPNRQLTRARADDPGRSRQHG